MTYTTQLRYVNPDSSLEITSLEDAIQEYEDNQKAELEVQEEEPPKKSIEEILGILPEQIKAAAEQERPVEATTSDIIEGSADKGDTSNDKAINIPVATDNTNTTVKKKVVKRKK